MTYTRLNKLTRHVVLNLDGIHNGDVSVLPTDVQRAMLVLHNAATALNKLTLMSRDETESHLIDIVGDVQQVQDYMCEWDSYSDQDLMANDIKGLMADYKLYCEECE